MILDRQIRRSNGQDCGHVTPNSFSLLPPRIHGGSCSLHLDRAACTPASHPGRSRPPLPCRSPPPPPAPSLPPDLAILSSLCSTATMAMELEGAVGRRSPPAA